MSSTDKLGLVDERDGWAVAWEVYSEDYGEDIGAYLGDGKYDAAKTAAQVEQAKTPDAFDGLEHAVACCAADEVVIQLPDSVWRRSEHSGFRFDRRVDAQRVLRAAQSAVKALRERAKQVAKNSTATWPMWALQAKAAGWKAPKGWKP
jgi:hypothetical protein